MTSYLVCNPLDAKCSTYPHTSLRYLSRLNVHNYVSFSIHYSPPFKSTDLTEAYVQIWLLLVLFLVDMRMWLATASIAIRNDTSHDHAFRGRAGSLLSILVFASNVMLWNGRGVLLLLLRHSHRPVNLIILPSVN